MNAHTLSFCLKISISEGVGGGKGEVSFTFSLLLTLLLVFGQHISFRINPGVRLGKNVDLLVGTFTVWCNFIGFFLRFSELFHIHNILKSHTTDAANHADLHELRDVSERARPGIVDKRT